MASYSGEKDDCELPVAEQLLKDRPVDLAGELTCGHGRYEIRDITLAAVDTEVSPFPHKSQIIKCTRIYLSTKEGAEPGMSVRLFGTSHEYGSKTAAQLGKLIRGHWTFENLNHWKRDASDWREERTPKRHPRGAKNLALRRNALTGAGKKGISLTLIEPREPPKITKLESELGLFFSEVH